jgi:allantoate deiminase
MGRAGMTVIIDNAGNIRGLYPGGTRRLIIGSHLDTVPHAGAFDGILGVVMGIALIERIGPRRLPLDIEVIGFSEEEGVRFGAPFIGSRAVIGDIDDELVEKIADAVNAFGLDASRISEARASDNALGYLEFHIEQGPVLESLDLPLGVVEAISGQSRLEIVFQGRANHAGTTPMHLRRDALAGAAEWIGAVEREAGAISGAVATIGRVDVSPGATNVIPGLVKTSLDVRHTDDHVRRALVDRLLRYAEQIASARCLTVSTEQRLDQSSVAMDPDLAQILEHAVSRAGRAIHRMPSGAGHDAMILARAMPAAMLFLRSPGGISHHPDESVLPADVAAALDVGMNFIEELSNRHA